METADASQPNFPKTAATERLSRPAMLSTRHVSGSLMQYIPFCHLSEHTIGFGAGNVLQRQISPNSFCFRSLQAQLLRPVSRCILRVECLFWSVTTASGLPGQHGFEPVPDVTGYPCGAEQEQMGFGHTKKRLDKNEPKCNVAFERIAKITFPELTGTGSELDSECDIAGARATRFRAGRDCALVSSPSSFSCICRSDMPEHSSARKLKWL